MKNSLGYLMKQRSIYRILIILILLFLFIPIQVKAEEKIVGFETEVSMNYSITENSELLAHFKYTLINNSDKAIPIKYFQSSISIPELKDLKVKVDNEYMIVTLDNFTEYVKFTSYLDNLIVPKGSSKDVSVYFKVPNFYKSNSPSISFSTYIEGSKTKAVSISFPSKFGTPIENDSYSITKNNNLYIINGKQFSKYLNVLFTDSSTYIYQQINTINNDTDNVQFYEISLPISKSYQVFLPGVVSTTPDNYYFDDEGNSYLQFKLKPGESKDIKLSGYILLDYSKSDEIKTSDFSNFLGEVLFWEYEDLDINESEKVISKITWASMNENKKSELLNAIGQYVNKKLTPTKGNEEAIRNGSLNLISDKPYENASQQDYVDLSIALLRKNQIPSIQIIGIIDPDGSDTTTFDTWVKFWDNEKGWINFDPYRVDIGDKNNFVATVPIGIELLQRGKDSTTPVFITYNLKRINIENVSSLVKPISQLTTSTEDIKINQLQKSFILPITIKNSGNTIITSYTISVDNQKQNINTKPIFPSQEVNIDIPINTSDLTTDKINITISGSTINSLIVKSSAISKITNENFWWWETFVTIISLIIFLLLSLFTIKIIKFINRKKK